MKLFNSYKKIFIALCFICITIVLSGCFEKAYQFFNDISEINEIVIVKKKDYHNYDENINEYLNCFEIITVIEDKDGFINDFYSLPFSVYYGDPTEVLIGEYAVLVNYNNGDYECVSWFSQDFFINGKFEEGRTYCNKETFNNFIEKYL